MIRLGLGLALPLVTNCSREKSVNFAQVNRVETGWVTIHNEVMMTRAIPASG